MTGSRYRYTLDDAIGKPQEWSFTWSLTDDVTFSTICGFCRQPHQRVSYEIARHTERLWICQRCARRYDLGGTLDSVALDQPAIRTRMLGLAARFTQQTCHDVIRDCLASIADPTLLEVALYFDRNLQLSPLHAACLFSYLPALPRTVDCRIFAIQTRSRAHQQEFGALDHAARTRVWQALTQQQKCRLASLGFAPTLRAEIRSRGRARPDEYRTATI